MSEYISLIATLLAAVLLGRATAWPRLRRLRAALIDAVWAAHHDPLTMLLNRAGLAAAHRRAQSAGQPMILALLDLDRFKTVNDTFGHHAGDDLLVEVADRIEETARRYGGIAARLGGDEFVALLPVRGAIAHAVHKLLTAIAAPVTLTVDGAPVTLTPSARAGGCWAEPDVSLDTLLRRADIALYQVKRDATPYAIYHPAMTMPATLTRRGPRLRDRREATA